MLNDISDWPPEVLTERSSSYVKKYLDDHLLIFFFIFSYKFSMVESFETVASGLVLGDNFDEFSFVQDQLTVSAAIVSLNIRTSVFDMSMYCLLTQLGKSIYLFSTIW